VKATSAGAWADLGAIGEQLAGTSPLSLDPAVGARIRLVPAVNKPGVATLSWQVVDATSLSSEMRTLSLPVVDATPPQLEANPPFGVTSATSAVLSVIVDEAGTLFYLVVPQGSTAPTQSEMHSVAVVAGVPNDVTLGGLVVNTVYDLYLHARDASNNSLSAPVLVRTFVTGCPTRQEFTGSSCRYPPIAQADVELAPIFDKIAPSANDGVSVSATFSSVVEDPDSPTASLSIAVVGATFTYGQWQVKATSGSAWVDVASGREMGRTPRLSIDPAVGMRSTRRTSTVG
jgi:hypothetical protein